MAKDARAARQVKKKRSAMKDPVNDSPIPFRLTQTEATAKTIVREREREVERLRRCLRESEARESRTATESVRQAGVAHEMRTQRDALLRALVESHALADQPNEEIPF